MLVHLKSNTSGGILPIFGLVAFLIFMMVGYALSLSLDTRAANKLQLTADTAALGGARAFMMSDSLKLKRQLRETQRTVRQLVKRNSDFELSGTEIEGVTEDSYGQHLRLTVELEFKPVNPAAQFTKSNANVEIRRKATVEATRGFPLCVLALAKTGRAIHMDSSQVFRAENCIVWSNSKSRRSMHFSQGASDAHAFCTRGKAVLTNGTVSPTPETKCRTLPDPLAGFDVEVSSTCDYTNKRWGPRRKHRLRPGVYCGGLILKGTDIELMPGIYVIRGGPLNLNAAAQIEAEGVTFVLDGTVKKVAIRGKGVRLVAPKDGPTAGMALAQNSGLIIENKVATITGAFDLEGVLYMPDYNLEIKQEARGVHRSPYIQMVVNRLSLQQKAHLDIEFNPEESDLPLVIKPERFARLVE